MSDEPWHKLHDGQSYKVYDRREDWLDWTPFGARYTVTAPSGQIIAVRGTVRGARRAIRRHQRRPGRELKWWEYPVVVEVPGQNSRTVASGDQTTGNSRPGTEECAR